MQVKISYDLRIKLLELTEENFFKKGDKGYVIYNVAFILDLRDNKKLLNECKKWVHHVNTYFKTSYKALKLNVGPFNGLWPIAMDEYFVEFRADTYTDKKDWKDWFIVEEIEDAPKFLT